MAIIQKRPTEARLVSTVVQASNWTISGQTES